MAYPMDINRPMEKTMYSPLKPGEIRTLCLEPGDAGAPLVASLEAVPRSNKTVAKGTRAPASRHSPTGFEAISYAWGAGVFDHELSIRDAGIFYITVSLFEALQRFRDSRAVRRLWADAVCINQFDTQEKSIQVKEMHLVYIEARTVLVWLGPCHQSDALAAATIHALPDTSWYEEHSCERGLDDLREELYDGAACPCCDSPYDSDSDDIAMAGLIAVADWIDRPWCTRMWVVQEVSKRYSDTRVFCGSHQVSLEKLQQANAALQAVLKPLITMTPQHLGISSSEATAIYQNTSRLNFEIFDASSHEGGLSSKALWRQVGDLSRRDCGDARDRVYAIRNCLGLEHIVELEPNYNLSTIEVYRQFSRAMMTRANFAGDRYNDSTVWTTLGLAGTESVQSDAEPRGPRPSWIPDFHHFTDRSRLKVRAFSGADNRTQFRSASSRFAWREIDEMRIEVRGRVYGVLEEVLLQSEWPEPLPETLETDQDDDSRLQAIVSWYHSCKEFTSSSINAKGRSANMVLHELLTGGELPNPTWPCTCNTYGDLEERLHQEWRPTDIRGTGGNLCHFMAYLFVADEHVTLDRGRVLCRFRCGHDTDVGWVPRSARAGDELCVIGGAPYPFVVRAQPDGSLRLLGDAYTVMGTLKQALGGSTSDTRSGARDVVQSFMDWNAKPEDDPVMSSLIDRLGWVTLS